MAFNEKLQKLQKEAQGIKPFNYDNVLRAKNELKKQHTLLEVKFKALTMEEEDANLWWDEVQYIVQKDTRKVCRRYERNERLFMHRIFQMEKVIPSFQYKPLIFIRELKTSYEEEEILMVQDH